MFEMLLELVAIGFLVLVLAATFEPLRSRVFKKPRSESFFHVVRLTAGLATVACLFKMILDLPEDTPSGPLMPPTTKEFRDFEQRFDKIKKGMTKKEVHAILGKPNQPDLTYVYEKDNPAPIEIFMGPPDDPDLKRRFPHHEKQYRQKWLVKQGGEFLVKFNMDDRVEETISSPFALPRVGVAD